MIDNPLGVEDMSTYKLATAGRPLGTLTYDGIAAIAGRVGPQPSTIPLTVAARNEATGRTRTLRVQVSDERSLDLGSGLDEIGSIAASEAMATVLDAAPPRFATSMCLRVEVAQRSKPLRFCQRYHDGYAPLEDLSAAFGLIDGYVRGPLGIRSVSVRLRLRPTVREAFIVAGRAPTRVRRGQRIRVRLLLQRSRSTDRRQVSFTYGVPRDAKRGLQILTVRGQDGGDDGLAALEDFFIELLAGGDGGGGQVKSVRDARRARHRAGQPDGVRATHRVARARARWSTATSGC